MEDSNLDPRLVNPGAGFAYAPTVGYTMTSDYSGCSKWDDQDLDIQTPSRADQVKEGKVRIAHVIKPVLTKEIKGHKPWSTGNNRISKRSSHAAKACTVKRVYGTEFLDSHGNTVDHLVMPTIKDAAAFLGCAINTVTSAMRRTGDEKGVVLGAWKVKEYEKHKQAEIESSIASHEESSWLQQLIDQESMAFNPSITNSHLCQSVAQCETPSKASSGITQTLSQTGLQDTVSV